ncbi:SPOR domain-containing protein [Tsuneonella sp. CC-YZS046]|uniref:SPOR domain-containing protein n=1 Tax=Tsuneonella sp. CC-YZS046 TaxID=3042152 RepID=UPI002D776EF3|nr:SPOR domain-containing protein [Tsuneonella sp. CC-YZS046]WRO67743.1 SPOR domain-containing protein [Tsuneonella sp. CC-YZS046]
MVIGDPFTIDGVTYTPLDTLNYDAVGYATLDGEAGPGVSAAHRTLPLPSYVEVTSLDTGRTILVRVERRGPMEGPYLIALSADAEKQLGSSGNAPIRVRRVNPPEQERALLRQKEAAPLRMDTPKSLVEVLRRKLPANPASSATAEPERNAVPLPGPSAVELPPSAAATPVLDEKSGTEAPQAEAAPVTAPSPVATPVSPAITEGDKPPEARAKPTVTNGFIVQVGAFSTEERAKRVADAIGGRVKKSKTLWLAQTGPFATRKEAEASLAKVAAKGYSGSRIYRTD